MGRSPICDRAMTSAERQRRYLARIREQARRDAMVAAPKPKSFRPDAIEGSLSALAHTFIALEI
jgi:hypothetical protein